MLGEVIEGDILRKNIGQISRKLSEGDELKKKLLIYLKKS